MSSAEQKAANDTLREAVAAACEVYGWAKNASLSEFVVVGVMAEDAPVQERVHTRYFTLLSDDSMPQHRVIGLLGQALHFYVT